MNTTNILFAALNLKPDDIKGKRVIEVGSYNVNGSLRPLVNALGPSDYVGVDIMEGPGVDVICDAVDLSNLFAAGSFDFIISTEMIEHVKDWRAIIHNLKNLCRAGGGILVTTRSRGFFYHGYPDDYWRYEIDDLKIIFQDFVIENIEKDPQFGVMIIAKKPLDFSEAQLQDHRLYSIIAGKRIKDFDDITLKFFRTARIAAKEKLRHFFSQLAHFLRSV